jgi:8-hydroxy-5-deazaflavin:NADPH oxidoreductase
MEAIMQIGFLGGTGVEGKGLSLRFAASGAEVILGSRSAEKAQAKAAEYNQILGKPVIRGMTNEAMLSAADMVFITLPFTEAGPAISGLGARIRPGTVLVDVTVPTRFADGRVEYLEQPDGSNAEAIAKHVPPGVELVGAFKTIPAHVLADLDVVLDCDVLICGVSKAAREKVMDAARIIPGLRPVDAGPLSTARVLERMTIFAIQLNRRYKVKGARFRIVGL